MNRLISESEVPDHNMSNHIQDPHQISEQWNDYMTKTIYKHPAEFNTVRLNDPIVRYKSKINASACNIKAPKR